MTLLSTIQPTSTIKMPLTEFMSRLGLDKRPVEVFVDWSNGGTVEIPKRHDNRNCAYRHSHDSANGNCTCAIRSHDVMCAGPSFR